MARETHVAAMDQIVEETDIPYYLASILYGLARFSLMLISIKKVIDEISLAYYPHLLALQAVFFILFLSSLNRLINRRPMVYQVLTLAIAALAIGIGTLSQTDLIPLALARHHLTLSVLTFFFSQLGLAVLDIGFHHFLSTKNPLLNSDRFPLINTLLTEAGYLCMAMIWLCVAENELISSIVSLLALAILFYLFSRKKPNIKKMVAIVEEKDSLKKPKSRAFMRSIIAIFTMVVTIKTVLYFGQIIGISALKKNWGTDLVQVFSVIAIIETVIIVGSIFISTFVSEKKLSWAFGFRLHFALQTVGFLTSAFIPLPMILVGASTLRRFSENTWINIVKKILYDHIPSSAQLSFKHVINQLSLGTGYALAALLIHLGYNGALGVSGLWLSMAILTISSIFLVNKSFQWFCQFQLEQLRSRKYLDKIRAVDALSYKECREYYLVLHLYLDKHPPAALAKRFIRALGEMTYPSSFQILIDYYNSTDREDIQMVIADALSKYETYEVDVFLLEEFKEMIFNQLALGNIKTSIVSAFAKRDSHTCIVMIFALYKTTTSGKEQDERILANILEVMGILNHNLKDKFIANIMTKYLNTSYSRRVVFNCVRYLYHQKEYRNDCNRIIETYCFSQKPHDRAAVCFLAGELRLFRLRDFVFQNSLDTNHTNPTLVFALVKLEVGSIFNYAAQLLVSENREIQSRSIYYLSKISQKQNRHRVYFYVFQQKGADIQGFLEAIKGSKLDLTADRFLLEQTMDQRPDDLIQLNLVS